MRSMISGDLTRGSAQRTGTPDSAYGGRTMSAETTATAGTISIDGRVGVMRQLVGTKDQTVRELMVSLAPARLQDAAARLARAESTAAHEPMRYATALAEWGDAGGYDTEVFWD